MKTLLYATLGYPGDLYSEKTFVDSELPALRKRFDRIILLPTDRHPRKSGYENALPEGVSVDWSLSDDRVYSTRWLKAIYGFHPFVLRALWMMRGEAKTVPQWLKGFFHAINIVRAGKIIRRVARRHGLRPDNTVFYSMWFADVASAMARLAGLEGWKFTTRAHTFDLYDDRPLFRSHSLRARLLRHVGHVLTISRAGRDYMRAQYPESAAKIICHPLGSTHVGEHPQQENSRANELISLVTTARLDPIKCLDLIMETLDLTARQLPEHRIRWILIGDGECRGQLEAQSRRLTTPNFEVQFMGALPNVDIQRLYDHERPDWYIMMSRSEGLPISMGEAMSHGMPVITTDVGDIHELVTPDCAVMLPPPYTRDSVKREPAATYAPLIARAITDHGHRQAMSVAARARWESYFNAETLSEETARLVDS